MWYNISASSLQSVILQKTIMVQHSNNMPEFLLDDFTDIFCFYGKIVD